jgi:hypothetical protein
VGAAGPEKPAYPVYRRLLRSLTGVENRTESLYFQRNQAVFRLDPSVPSVL